MTIEQIIQERGIEGVLHFTTNRGLVGVLVTKSLLARRQLKQEDMLEYVLHVNAKYRPEAAADFDKSEDWLNYVNLSISEVNTRFLEVSKRWHNDADVWWCILEFDPIILSHDGVYFATTNNSYGHCVREEGVGGFSALFQDSVRRKADWRVVRGSRRSNLPTCEQAEVLYPESLGVKYLNRIYVAKEEHYDIAGGWVKEFDARDVEVLLSSAKFVGVPN